MIWAWCHAYNPRSWNIKSGESLEQELKDSLGKPHLKGKKEGGEGGGGGGEIDLILIKMREKYS